MPMEDLGIDRKFSEPQQIRALGEVDGSYTYFAEGDVLLAKITPCFENGKLGIARGLTNGAGFGSSEFIVFRPSSEIDREWLYYFLSRDSFRREGETRMGGAVGHKRVALDFIEGYEIPLPPLPEQKRIVAILDEAFAGIDAAIANTQQATAQAKQLLNERISLSLSNAQRGWVSCRIGDVAQTQYGLSVPMNTDQTGYKIFRMGEVQSGRLIDTGAMKYADITEEEFKKYKLKPRDVLFNRTNSFELVGKTGIFNLDGEYCFASYLVRIRPDPKKLLPEYLNRMMNSDLFQRAIKAKASRSINQANISASILAAEPVNFPADVAEQRQVVEALDDMEAMVGLLVANYQQKALKLASLKQSILAKAFAGELTTAPSRLLDPAPA